MGRSSTKPTPVALTIAGSDCGGGAGIQADLKTFAALGVFGTSVITCITAQNPVRFSTAQPLATALIQRQLESILRFFPVKAAKTGMLGNDRITRLVAKTLASHRDIQWVVDPVMRASTGGPLCTPSGIKRFQRDLLPLATLVTPNIPEAEAMARCKIRSVPEMKQAARALSQTWGTACLLKGGHLAAKHSITDVLCVDGETHVFTGPRLTELDLHGTGCTLSAAITAHLAQGHDLITAIERGRAYLRECIQNPVRLGAGDVMAALGWDTKST